MIQPIKRPIEKMRFQVAIERPIKDHEISLHLTTDVFSMFFNSASALFSPICSMFEEEQDWGP